MTQVTIRLYSYSIAARRKLARKEVEFEHECGAVVQNDTIGAYEKALVYARVQWPTSQGWENHTAKVTEIVIEASTVKPVVVPVVVVESEGVK